MRTFTRGNEGATSGGNNILFSTSGGGDNVLWDVVKKFMQCAVAVRPFQPHFFFLFLFFCYRASIFPRTDNSARVSVMPIIKYRVTSRPSQSGIKFRLSICVFIISNKIHNIAQEIRKKKKKKKKIYLFKKLKS